MTRVKICGLTQEADVQAACEAGADAVGFVMVPGTRRAVTPERVRDLVRHVHPFVLPVGVIRDEALEAAIALAEASGVRALQLHGQETPDEARALKRAKPELVIVKAVQVRAPGDLARLDAWQGVDALLLDSGAGSGQPFDWDWLAGLNAPALPCIVAGGLTPENVTALLSRWRPAAVDVSSGVESAPGRKDPQRVRAFIRHVKQVSEFVPPAPRV